jgi:hypothetical protein
MTPSFPIGRWCAAAVLALAAGGGDAVTLDFSKEKLPEGFTTRGKEWKVAGGELQGLGDGALNYAGPIVGDFTLSFQAWSAEKTNFEVKLHDAATGKECYTFAFLGRYHGALKCVACCMLRQDGFVAIDPKMWIYPGRKFTCEVRLAKGQMQMFLDGELGPLFVDPQPLKPEKGFKVEILASTEGSKDAVKLDDVSITFPAAGR